MGILTDSNMVALDMDDLDIMGGAPVMGYTADGYSCH
jgi:hypothetical protein